MTQEELEKLSISDVYYILMNEKEYYSVEEIAMLEKGKESQIKNMMKRNIKKKLKIVPKSLDVLNVME